MSFFKNERNWVILLLTVLAGVLITVVFLTQSSFGGGDHYEHYKLAHFGWKYPKMLFNHWGKPVFTILISPFAQFGINAARVYNVLMAILTAFLTWKLAMLFKFKYSWLVIIFVLFTPIYFASMFAVLTEITFSFFLVFSVLLFFKERFILSALVLSFLPLVRTEGIILWPIFILAYSLKKQFKALPFLAVGFLIFSALGRLYHSDFWWLITEMPYTGNAKDLYGSGSLMHFVNHTPNITGGPIGIIFVVGLVALIISWLKVKETKLNEWFFFILLIPGSFLTFFAAHSFVWWQGMGNSLGLIRVIAAVSPLAALTALYGLQSLLKIHFKYQKVVAVILILGISIWIIIDGIQKHKKGFYLGKPEMVLEKAIEFIKDNNLIKYKIYYFDNYINFRLNMDPNDPKQAQWYVQNKKHPALGIPDSSIIIWDAHFGPNEGGVQLDILENEKDLHKLKVFKPAVPFKLLGGYDYQVIIFQKLDSLK